ncbi:MAG: hypothetical protein A2475_01125 [Ignavibacteria bacterium RIFOXYC2_FULL_35_21]|nr:MAG: hypothetical protein A2220_01920 [Ignavibacteria bacterium RIFOXYA2_FULL_35_10]OGV21248.1 MAG: hypothetical protein A2475_01125 [Ignavibacteria bacterium RIFOXYC2_FULL_35_21]
MKRNAILIITFFLFTGILLSQPKLKIECGDTYNWGNVKEKDSPLKAKVKLYNVGTDSLKIMNVKPTCGCTTAPLDKNVLGPGDSATLDIKLTISGISGALHKTINIKSNDSLKPNAVLHLRAEVEVPVTFYPSKFFAFGQMYVGEEAKRSVKMINKTNQRIMLKDIDMQPPSIEVNIEDGDILPPNGEIEIIATITPDKAGTFSCRLTFKTNHPDLPEVNLTGWGNINNEKPKSTGNAETVKPK